MNHLKTAQELFKRERRPGDLVFAVVFLAFALFLLWNLPTQVPWADGTSLAAQPALWPTVSILGMVVFGTFHFIGSVCSPRIDGRWSEVWLWLRAVEFGGWFLGYVLVLSLLGYLPASLVFAVALTVRLGYRSRMAICSAAEVAIAILLPVTFSMEPIVGLTMLLGIYGASMYGGAIPAVLINTPGTPVNVLTTYDGYAITKAGDPRRALACRIRRRSTAACSRCSA